jgi:hypothetical protein
MVKNTLNRRAWLFVFLLIASAASAAHAQEKTVLFREDFATLGNWKPFYFPKIEKHSVYTVEKSGGQHYLKAESNASASAIVYKDSFNVYDFPKARWRWKVMNLYARGDPRNKKGDDYPIRVYIMFEYDPDAASALEKLKYGLAKKIYGVYPPHSSLSYVWTSKNVSGTVLASPYTDQAMMIFLEKGEEHVGVWRDEEVDIVADYQKAFGTKPPASARIAIMNDSDNTGENSVSYVEYIEVLK